MNKIIISLCLVLLIFSGCGRRTQDLNTITVWHWMTDRDEVFQQLAKKYEEKTGIKVTFELYAPSDAYSKKIVVAAQARVLPDIFGVLGEKKTFASFIENGFIAELTPYFNENNASWKNALFEKAIDASRFVDSNVYGINPGIYGVPIDVTNIQMLYNKKLLKKAGIKSVPQTFDEFLDAIKALHKVGIGGMVSGWGEIWLIDCFASNYAFNIMGKDKVMATYKGEVPYTDSDWIKVFDVFKQLADNNAFVSGIVTKGNKYAEQDFALERAAFAFNGSWCVNTYHRMNPKLEYGTMLPPAVNPDMPMKIWGSAGSTFVVNNASDRKNLAINFLKWLTEKDQQVFLAQKTKNLPSNREALGYIPDELSDFALAMDKTTHPTVWKYNEQSMVTEAFDKGIQSIIIGEKTPKEVAVEVQKVKQREMARAKKLMR